MTKLILLSILVLLINIPFGYWRSNVRRFSWQWFLAIHIPVVFIIVIRFVSGIGFAWETYVFFVLAYFLGQQSGSVILKRIHAVCANASSCLVMDIVRCSRSGAV